MSKDLLNMELFFQGGDHDHEQMLHLALKSIHPRAESSSIEIPLESLISLTYKNEAAKCARKAVKRKNTRDRAYTKRIQVRSAWEEFNAELKVVGDDGSEDKKDVECEFENGPTRESETADPPPPTGAMPPRVGRVRKTCPRVASAWHSGCSLSCECFPTYPYGSITLSAFISSSSSTTADTRPDSGIAPVGPGRFYIAKVEKSQKPNDEDSQFCPKDRRLKFDLAADIIEPDDY